MKLFRTHLIQFLLATSLLLPWTATGAMETFDQAGFISDIGYEQFTVKKRKYRVAPGAEIKSPSDPFLRRKFSDFKVGDEVYFKGNLLSGVYYVDIIVYYKPVPQ